MKKIYLVPIVFIVLVIILFIYFYKSQGYKNNIVNTNSSIYSGSTGGGNGAESITGTNSDLGEQ